MSSHSMLLHLAGLLRQRYARRPDFNLFTTLRGANDEVSLHSRFIAALLDPKTHSLGSMPLQKLLNQCDISGFSLEGLKVECERQHIDILVTNTRGQAFFIENKINAGDQPEQLVRYHQTLQSKGYQEIHVCYLTLDGGDPEPGSLGDLRHKPNGSYTALGYYTNMVPWLDDLLGRAALDPPLRESLAQYRQLILQLTGNDMNNDHLEALTETLLQGDNLQNAYDIRLAYDEALIRLHAKLWRSLREHIDNNRSGIAKYIRLNSWEDAALDGYCRQYAQKRGVKTWFGLYYSIPGYSDEACAGLVVEDGAIFTGIYCDRNVSPASYQAICASLDEHDHAGSRNAFWPSYSYGPRYMTFRTPYADMLAYLSDSDSFSTLVASMAGETIRLWDLCKSEC